MCDRAGRINILKYSSNSGRNELVNFLPNWKNITKINAKNHKKILKIIIKTMKIKRNEVEKKYEPHVNAWHDQKESVLFN